MEDRIVTESRLVKLEEQTKNTDNTVKRIESKLDDFTDTVERRYADKWVEWAIKSLIGALIMIGAYVMVFLITNSSAHK